MRSRPGGDVIFSGLMSISKLRSNESKQEESLPPVNRCLWTVVRKAHRARQIRLAEDVSAQLN
jgi:hypothetical protein